jgi:hypothetical protein
MKQTPQIILARDLADRIDPWPETSYVPEKDENNNNNNVALTFSENWFPVRPKPKGGFFTRLELAWGVFTGKYDALKWDNQ